MFADLFNEGEEGGEEVEGIAYNIANRVPKPPPCRDVHGFVGLQNQYVYCAYIISS